MVISRVNSICSVKMRLSDVQLRCLARGTELAMSCTKCMHTDT